MRIPSSTASAAILAFRVVAVVWLVASLGRAEAAADNAAVAFQAFSREYLRGRIFLAKKHLPALIGDAERDRETGGIQQLRLTSDACLSALDFDCADEVHAALARQIESRSERGVIDPGFRQALVTDLVERTARLWMETGLVSGRFPELIRRLEGSVAEPLNTIDFAQANLTIARGYVQLGDLERAGFYVRRGWFYFLSNQEIPASRLLAQLPSFVDVFMATGQVNRALIAMQVARPLMARISNAIGSPYETGRLLLTDLEIQDQLNDAAAIARLGSSVFALAESVDLSPATRAYVFASVRTKRLSSCLLIPAESCRNDEDALALLNFLRDPSTAATPALNHRAVQDAAASLALYFLVAKRPVPDAVVRVLAHDVEPGRRAGQGMIVSVNKLGRSLVSWRQDESGSRALLAQSLRLLLEDSRKVQATDPFVAVPMPLLMRGILQLGVGSLVLGRSSLSDEDGDILLEAMTLLGRGPRSIESNYLYAVSHLKNEGSRASVRAYHRIDQTIREQEREALQEFVDIGLGDKKQGQKLAFDVDRWMAFNELFELQQPHVPAVRDAASVYRRPSRLFTETRTALLSDERFIANAVAPTGVVRFCFDKETAFVGVTAFDPGRAVAAVKMLHLALTNPMPPSQQADATFPIEEAAHLTDLLLGQDERCAANAANLIVAPVSEFFAVPLHILLDPVRRRAVDVLAGNATTPWLGTSRGLSVFTDPRQFAAIRAQQPTDVAPFAFLGIGDPVLSGRTTDDEVQSKVALRGVKRGAAGTLKELDELPQTRRELETLAAIFGPTSRVLVGNAASEVNVRRQALGDFRIVSFATHGLVREEIAGLAEPALVLTPRDGQAAANDGLLTATEIAQLHVPADLVMLSACNSASFDLGLFAPEAAGLSTAFMLAGARSTMASLWSVESEATAQLMELVARNLSSAPEDGSAQALRRALDTFTTRPESSLYRHPRFWSAFVLFGDGGRTPVGGRTPARSGIEVLSPVPEPVWGEWNQSERLTDGSRIEAGYEDVGAATYRGVLRLVRDASPVWSVTDGFAFMLPRGAANSYPMALAWSADRTASTEGLKLELRRYSSPDGKLSDVRSLDSAGDSLPGGIVSLGRDRFVVASSKNNNRGEGESFTLQMVDFPSGPTRSRRVPLPASISNPEVRLMPSVEGFWVVISGLNRHYKPQAIPLTMGARDTCLLQDRVELRRFGTDLSPLGEPKIFDGIQVAQIQPADGGRDVAALTITHSCYATSRESAALAMISKDKEPEIFRIPIEGASRSGRAVVRLPTEEWLLVSRVSQRLDRRRPREAVIGGGRSPEWWARSISTGEQQGLHLARFDIDGGGTAAATADYVISNQFGVVGAHLAPDGTLIFLGHNNGGQYVGKVSVP